MTCSSAPRNLWSNARMLRFLLRGRGPILAFACCAISPCASAPPSIRHAVITSDLMPAASASGPSAVVVLPPSVAGVSSPSAAEAPVLSRVTVDRNNGEYLIDFPTSISPDGRRIAAMVSVDGQLESYFPEWLAIKDLEADRTEQVLDVIDPALSGRLNSTENCVGNLAPCIAEAQRMAEAVNAVLAQDRWHPFPCIYINHSSRPDRMDPGCELLEELRFEYKDPRLIISREGRPVVTRMLPSWSPKYRKPKCTGVTIDTYVESVAFDPGTGLFVISLRFVGPEGNFECPTPRWDFHPIRLPMFRRGAGREDGGALGPAPEGDGGGP